MHEFKYIGDELFCEDVGIGGIAAAAGTPFYLYSAGTLTHHYRVFNAAFAEFPHIVCFAVKANANLAILRLFGRLGAGADIVSGGELYRALAAGVDGIVSSGLEAPMIRRELGDKLMVVTPGIRPVENKSVDDQERTVDVAQAFNDGADYIVVGRPIRQAADPRQAALRIQQTIREVFSQSGG